MSNLRQIGLALTMYANENKGEVRLREFSHFATSTSFATPLLNGGYLKSNRVFACPRPTRATAFRMTTCCGPLPP
jgi:hypothetical protein